MNKKFIPIIIIIAIVFLGLGVYLFFTLNPARQGQLQNTLQNLFPFGQTEQTTETPSGGITTEPVQEVTPSGTVIETNIPVFRRVSDIPTNSYTTLVTEELKEMPRTVVQPNGETVVVNELRPIKKYSVRFGSITNGAVYESTVNGTIVTSQLTDSHVAGIDHALFGKSGSMFAIQYVNGSFGNETIGTHFSFISPVPLIVEPCPFGFPVNLKFQDNNEAVANIQRFLNGYLGIIISATGENSPGNETGIYDELTREAVRKFQTANNLTADGNVGPNTRKAFEASCVVVQTKKAQELYRQNNTFLYRISGVSAVDNIVDIKNIDENALFYLLKGSTRTFGFIYDTASRTPRQVFDSPFSEWATQPLSRERIIFTTKASGEALGYAYELDLRNGTFKKIIGDLMGLTTLTSPDGNTVLIGSATNGGYEMSLLKRDTNSAKPLGIKTLPEKCTWNTSGTTIYCAVPNILPTGTYPDVWYQGIVSTTDTLWSINVVTGATEKMYDPQEIISGGITLGNLQATNDGRYLFMKNLNDDTLWVFSLLQ